MTLDHRSIYFHRVQSVVSVVAIPFQYFVDWPIEFFQWAESTITTQNEVLEENAKLRAQQLLLQAKLQRVVALESENAQLRALLQSSPHVGGRFAVAQLLAVNMDPFVQKVVLDKGSLSDVFIGQPVLDAYGVMGQVIQVGPLTSQVLLVTDSQSGISVQDNRNGIRAIASGMGDGRMQLVNIPDSTDIQLGDVMVTSGLDQRFPAGYPVGVVKRVSRDPEYRFAAIILEPSAHLNQNRMVLLVWPSDTTKSNSETAPADVERPRVEQGATP
jgi:rod shape-determining protein MreC